MSTKPVARIIPTRHADLQPVYAKFVAFYGKHTGLGGRDELIFEIPECPTIITSEIMKANSLEICYKKLETQKSGGGTHFYKVYLVLATKQGSYRVGYEYYLSNSHRTERKEDWWVQL